MVGGICDSDAMPRGCYFCGRSGCVLNASATVAARAHFFGERTTCSPQVESSVVLGCSHVRARLQVFKKMVGVRGNIRLIEFSIFARMDFALRRLCAHYRKHVLDAPLR